MTNYYREIPRSLFNQPSEARPSLYHLGLDFVYIYVCISAANSVKSLSVLKCHHFRISSFISGFFLFDV